MKVSLDTYKTMQLYMDEGAKMKRNSEKSTPQVDEDNPAAVFERNNGGSASQKGVIYDRNGVNLLSSSVGSVENRQFQNNLKLLGFYNPSVATDGNLGSAESLRAIRNFQRVYGLPISGGSNNETRNKLTEVVNFYNATLANPNLKDAADCISDTYRDYNEASTKADIARCWTFLKKGMGLNSVQAAAVMGNLLKESGASPTNRQDKDGVYTLRDNSYLYAVNDGYGYGIMQWTYSSRKQGLLNMAETMGSSVKDVNVQFAFMRKELESAGSYNNAWKKIKASNDLENCTKYFMEEIEGYFSEESLKSRIEKANKVYNALA